MILLPEHKIPPPERHVLFVRCPRCRARIWNALFTHFLAYELHYIDHLLADMKAARVITDG